MLNWNKNFHFYFYALFLQHYPVEAQPPDGAKCGNAQCSRQPGGGGGHSHLPGLCRCAAAEKEQPVWEGEPTMVL